MMIVSVQFLSPSTNLYSRLCKISRMINENAGNVSNVHATMGGYEITLPVDFLYIISEELRDFN